MEMDMSSVQRIHAKGGIYRPVTDDEVRVDADLRAMGPALWLLDRRFGIGHVATVMNEIIALHVEGKPWHAAVKKWEAAHGDIEDAIMERNGIGSADVAYAERNRPYLNTKKEFPDGEIIDVEFVAAYWRMEEARRFDTYVNVLARKYILLYEQSPDALRFEASLATGGRWWLLRRAELLGADFRNGTPSVEKPHRGPSQFGKVER